MARRAALSRGPGRLGALAIVLATLSVLAGGSYFLQRAVQALRDGVVHRPGGELAQPFHQAVAQLARLHAFRRIQRGGHFIDGSRAISRISGQ